MYEVLPLCDLSKSLLSHIVSDSKTTTSTNSISRQGKEGVSPQTAKTECGGKSLLSMAVLPFKTILL